MGLYKDLKKTVKKVTDPIVKPVVGAVKGAAGGLGKALESISITSPFNKAVEKVNNFVKEEIPGGWATVAVVAGGAYLASAAGGAGTAAGTAGTAAGGAGTAAGTGAVVTPVAGWGGTVTPITAGGVAGGVAGGTGLLSGATGQGLTAIGAGAPEIASMGGGTGLLTSAAGGGILGATGVTPIGAVPILGSPSSFINNPNVLGQFVIGAELAPTLSISNVLRAANLANVLFGQKPQQQQPQQQQPQQQLIQQGMRGLQTTGIDLLNIPQFAARRAEIQSLLSPSIGGIPSFDPVSGMLLERNSLLG